MFGTYKIVKDRRPDQATVSLAFLKDMMQALRAYPFMHSMHVS